MKPFLTFFALAFLLLTSCRRDNILPIQNIAGAWRMVSVQDIPSNTITTKPASINGNVDINFLASTNTTGGMSGVTPTNTFNGGYFLGYNNTLSIPSFSQTKVIETSWGEAFLDNIRFINGLSFEPNGNLNLHTNGNKVFVFTRR